jgi:hypothetical protein
MARRLVACAILGTAAVIAAVFGLPEPAYSHKPITTNILFKNEIAQIFQRKCFQCHSDNNLSMSLTSYTAARPWARAIREEVLDRQMPPWSAVRGYGHFANDLSLNQREMEIILSWADGGAPSGVLKAEEDIVPVFVPPAPTWDAGAPDVVLPIGKGHVVDAGAGFSVKRFVVPTGFTAPRRIRAFALKQGDRRVVRHAAFYEEGSGRWLAAWTPWQTAMPLPDGVSYRAPARARIVVDIGYVGADEAVTDKSELGLYFDTAATASEAKTSSITAKPVALPAGAAAHRVRAETRLTVPASVVALFPEPGPTARSIEVNAIAPDGVVTPLLWVKDYRPEWQTPYLLSRPVALAAGTRLLMTTYFDNAGDAPATVAPKTFVLTTPATARR